MEVLRRGGSAVDCGGAVAGSRKCRWATRTAARMVVRLGGGGCRVRVEGEEKIRVRVLGDEGDDVAESDWLIW